MHFGSVKAIAFFIIWTGLVVAVCWYFFIQPQQWFDASKQQPPVLSLTEKQNSLRVLLQQVLPQLTQGKSWFVRIKQSDCRCERFVESYHRSFSAQSDEGDMQIATLDLVKNKLNAEQIAVLQNLIPATPAVVLFDRSGVLSYFGPYHQEGICSTENSFLEPVLQALQQGKSLSVLNTLVYGCFCSTQADGLQRSNPIRNPGN